MYSDMTDSMHAAECSCVGEGREGGTYMSSEGDGRDWRTHFPHRRHHHKCLRGISFASFNRERERERATSILLVRRGR